MTRRSHDARTKAPILAYNYTTERVWVKWSGNINQKKLPSS